MNQEPDTISLKASGLPENVHTLSEISFEVENSGNEIIKTFLKKIVQTYNPRGNRTEEAEYDEEDRQLSLTRWSYTDSDGFSEIDIYEPESGNLKTVFIHDGNNRLIEERVTDAAGGVRVTGTIVYRDASFERNFFNGDGELEKTCRGFLGEDGRRFPEEIISLDASGDVIKKERRSYHENGELLSIQSWETKAGRVHERTEIHDDRGNTLEVREERDGTGVSSNRFRYDESGNRIEHSWQYVSGDAGRSVTGYDTQGRPIAETSYDSSGSIFEKTVTEYRPDGCEVVSTTTDGDGTVTLVSRSIYDSHQNLVESATSDGSGTIISRSTFRYDGRGSCIELYSWFSEDSYADDASDPAGPRETGELTVYEYDYYE